MAESYKILGQTTPPSASWAALYTVPSTKQAVLSSIAICNTNAASAIFSIATQQNGAEPGLTNYLSYNSAVDAYDTLFISNGITLDQNDILGVYSPSASVVFQVFGSEIS